MTIHYEEVSNAFDACGPAGGLESFITNTRESDDHHSLFRALLLKKRFELGLPLVNPGDLKNYPENVRKQYEDFVEQTCREIGHLYLKDKDIAQAWRYFRTLGETEPVRKAIEEQDAAHVSEDTLNVAIQEGVHPQRGFQLTLESLGICRAISVFESEFSVSLEDKKFAASLLVHALYKELVLGVSRAILERFGEMPPETDLVELIRHRPWLFEDGKTHADASHVASVARIGLILEDQTDLIMALSISEYGRMLSVDHHPAAHAPFEAGFSDYSKYARALLGQNVDETVKHFRSKLVVYSDSDRYPAEMMVSLLWRVGRKDEALDVWQQYLAHFPPELPGVYIPSLYELCIQAKEFRRLAEVARLQGDSAVWAAARVMDCTPSAAPSEKSAQPEQAVAKTEETPS